MGAVLGELCNSKGLEIWSEPLLGVDKRLGPVVGRWSSLNWVRIYSHVNIIRESNTIPPPIAPTAKELVTELLGDIVGFEITMS